MVSVALKKYFKLMNDSVYDKIMERLRTRVKVRLVKDAKDY